MTRATRRLCALHPTVASAPTDGAAQRPGRAWLRWNRGEAVRQFGALLGGLVALLVTGPLVPVVIGPVAWPARLAVAALAAKRLRSWLRSLPSSRPGPGTARLAVPAVADLLALAVQAGASPAEALEVVARTLELPGGVADRPAATAAQDLATVSRLLRLGASPQQAWERLGAGHPLASVGLVLARGEAAGTTLAATLTLLADRERARTHREAMSAAQRAAVHAVVPLGLLFLPAFLLLGVAPVLISAVAALRF